LYFQPDNDSSIFIYDIVNWEGVDWVHLAQNMNQWRSLWTQ